MRRQMSEFLNDEQGQDLIEYTLLLAFCCLVAAASYIGLSGSMSTIWVFVNSRLASANQVP
jgi:Flp pilus assembly pilin Flp